jgi:flagellar hook protein FlgE
MFTAIGALTLHQSFMDVVADNLANANTPGYKASRVSFLDQIAQRMAAGSAPTTTLGGINPTQIGLGVRMGGTTPNFVQGTLQSTGRVSDVALQGDGFFVYRDGTNRLYSRDGALDLDADGYLVNTSTGMRVQGWQASGSAATINTGLPLSDLQIPLNSTLARATVNATLRGNLDSTTASGSAGAYNATIGVYDSLGVLHDVTVTYTMTTPGNWSWSATSGSPAVSVGSGTVAFDTSGQYVSGGGSITVPASGGAAATTATLDMSGMTQLATANSAALSNQDGLAAGSLSGFSVISNTGEVFGVYSNGLQQRIGQVALATFVNPAGLLRSGQSVYQEGLNSGTAQIGAAGSGGRGTVVSGYLEASNVDMAQEFTNMILAQRGFQASSRVITASDEMLQELVNLKR